MSISVFFALLFSISATSQVNYIRTWDAKAPQQNGNTLVSRPLREVQQTTQYIDGLGRPLQTVVKQGSLITGSSAKDLIQPVEYDAFGRQAKQHLPYASTANTGAYRAAALTEQPAFYNSTDISKNPVAGQTETHFYGYTTYEASPLNRVLEQYGPGKNWAGTHQQSSEANRRGVKTKYYVNTALDGVRIWNVTIAAIGDLSSYHSPGTYPAGELYKTVVIDENNKQVIEFKDKEGKVILKKVQHTADPDLGAGSGHDGWLCTYYLYDDLGNLRCVLQPRGAELIKNTWGLANAVTLAQQCFRYEYDHRNRMIIKKVPAKGAEYMVYDARDRLVMYQDSKLRQQGFWQVTLYDHLNRPVQTGLMKNSYAAGGVASRSFTSHLTAANASTAYPFAHDAPPSTTYWEYLTKTGYDNYSTIPSASGLDNTLETAQITSTYGFFTTYNASPNYAQQLTTSGQTRGMVTWTQTKVLGSTAYQYSVNIYDSHGRLIQVKSKNHLGGADIVTTQYNWSGQPLVNVQKQVKPSPNAQTSYTITKYVYDDLGRLVRTDKKIRHNQVNANAMPSSYTTVNRLEYDALGQVKQKSVGNKPGGSTPLSVASHRYNIRGWLLDVNKEYIAQTSNADQYFGFELGYDKNPSLGTFTPQYNGNISGVLWKAEGDQAKRRYRYTYDAANRLKTAAFTQYASGSGTGATFNNANGMDFSVSNLLYDANGNLTRKIQKGLILNTAHVIDDLSYYYLESNGNRLARVEDAASPAVSGRLGDFKDGTNSDRDYGYDYNANLTKDLNKNIETITYNHLNLPVEITVTGKGTITYTYDAAGNKLKKTTQETGASISHNGTDYTNVDITTTTNYIGGYVYESKAYSNGTLNTALGYTDKLQLIAHEEGRVRPLFSNAATPHTPTGLTYDYFLKDHLGNTRMVLTEEQKTDVYPAATMETAQAANEEALYDNIAETRYLRSNISLYPNDPTTSPNAYVAKVRASTGNQKIGPAITLKVMAGDNFNVKVSSWYKLNGTTPGTPLSPLTDLVAAMLGSVGAAAAPVHGGNIVNELESNGILTPEATAFLNSRSYTTGRPKAYLNWILLDEQFKYVSEGSGVEQVGGDQVFTQHVKPDMPVTKNGYLYVYVSNETPNVHVFFDNLQVTHTRGPILEETHYYPFGLTMAGISSKTLNNVPVNKYGITGKEIQNKEFSDGSGLELYDFSARTYDHQIGRFLQIDLNSLNYYAWTPYNYCANNPISIMDPTGMDWYTDNEGRYQYDPNITKDSKLQEGQTYVGVAHQVKDKKGNVIENYRKDGSIMYAKESSAYTRMIERSEQTGSESMAALTDNGTLVLPDYKNDKSTVDLADYGYSTKNGNIVDASGKEYNTTATVHTHPDGSGPSTYTGNGYGDLGFATYSTPNKPVFVIQMKGGKNDPISFIIAAPNPTRKAADFNYQIFPVTQQIPAFNAQGIQSLPNSVNLKQFVKQNKDNMTQLLRR